MIYERDLNGESPRDLLAERWRKAPVQVIEYDGALAEDGTYLYLPGKRLEIAGKQVMDTCEFSWVIENVDRLIVEAKRRHPELIRHPEELSFLDFGFGLGGSATRFMQHLLESGGTLDIVELNEQIFNDSIEWAKGQIDSIASQAHGLPVMEPRITINVYNDQLEQQDQIQNFPLGPTHRITVNLYNGDSAKIARLLAIRGNRYHGIQSDTYPIDKKKESLGRNDLIDLQWKVACLVPGGVFTFCAHFHDSPGGIVGAQKDLIWQHFGGYSVVREVSVNSHPDYKFLHRKDGSPVTSLPVVICYDPRIPLLEAA